MKPVRALDPEAKRAAILAAGEQLFAAQGFAKTTMAQIAAEANVAVGSLYRAFPDKLALLGALHAAMEQRFIDVILASWASDQRPAERFRAMIEAIMRHALAVRASMPLYMMTRDLVSSGGQEPGARTVVVIAKLYAAGVDRNEFRQIPAQPAAAIGYGIVEGGMRDLMARGQSEGELSEAVDIMTDCFVRAFVVDASGPP